MVPNTASIVKNGKKKFKALESDTWKKGDVKT